MRKRKFIFGGLAGLMFMAFVAMNLTVSQSYEKDGTAQLTLTELAAKAQWEGEMAVDFYSYPIDCSTIWTGCNINAQHCYEAPGWRCDISGQSSCAWFCN